MFIATEEYQRYRGSKIYFENILDWDGNWDDHKETDDDMWMQTIKVQRNFDWENNSTFDVQENCHEIGRAFVCILQIPHRLEPTSI